jgi:hypothetical protein
VQERIVRRSKLDWVIVRPVILTNGPKTNAYRALVDPRGLALQGLDPKASAGNVLVIQDQKRPTIRRYNRTDALRLLISHAG